MSKSRVYVCFWFDVEDYVTPQSDDALLRLARIFTEEGVSATFKFVGEKARRLKQRRREDVLAAAREHDIGYHTDFHSLHPTVSEYLKGVGWEEGAAEFERRERRGLEDVQEILGKPCSTYGQPGASWAPQVYPVLRQWGVPTYVDEAHHVGLHDQPFWYCGVLNVLRMRSRCTRMRLGGGHLDQGLRTFNHIAEELDEEGGGLISIFYHPCEWATTVFWDGVNFARGRNTPLDALITPPIRPQAASEADFTDFAAYLRHIANSGATLVTCAELPHLYPDQWAAHPLGRDDVLCLAWGLADEVTYQPVRLGWASAAEALGVVVEALGRCSNGLTLDAPMQGRYVEGPTARPAADEACEVTREAFLAAAQEVRDHIARTGRVPSQVAVGGHRVGPATFAQAAAQCLLAIFRGEEREMVVVSPASLTCEREIQQEGVWGWSIFPEGFEAPGLIELGRLQAWTLKPALLRY